MERWLKKRPLVSDKADSGPPEKKTDFIKKNTSCWDLQQLIRTLSSLCVFYVERYFQTMP